MWNHQNIRHPINKFQLWNEHELMHILLESKSLWHEPKVNIVVQTNTEWLYPLRNISFHICYQATWSTTRAKWNSVENVVHYVSISTLDMIICRCCSGKCIFYDSEVTFMQRHINSNKLLFTMYEINSGAFIPILYSN